MARRERPAHRSRAKCLITTRALGHGQLIQGTGAYFMSALSLRMVCCYVTSYKYALATRFPTSVTQLVGARPTPLPVAPTGEKMTLPVLRCAHLSPRRQVAEKDP